MKDYKTNFGRFVDFNANSKSNLDAFINNKRVEGLNNGNNAVN